jgi:hypothetical protein
MLGVDEAKTHQFIYAPCKLHQIGGFPVTLMTYIANFAAVIVSAYEVYGLAQTVVVHKVCYQGMMERWNSGNWNPLTGLSGAEREESWAAKET